MKRRRTESEEQKLEPEENQQTKRLKEGGGEIRQMTLMMMTAQAIKKHARMKDQAKITQQNLEGKK